MGICYDCEGQYPEEDLEVPYEGTESEYEPLCSDCWDDFWYNEYLGGVGDW